MKTESRFTLPAEWNEHESTWLTWPQNTETWQGNEIQEARSEYIHFLRAILESEKVNLLVNDHRTKLEVIQLLQSRELEKNLTIHIRTTNDAWIRDYGPDFVRSENGLNLINWEYNSWGGKYPPFDDDNRVYELVEAATGYPIHSTEMILEAGSIDINDSGTLLTTESCLLNPNRNPKLTKADIESKLIEYYGAKEIIWLKDGIAGDDTDGHVDDISRFINNSTIVTSVSQAENHQDYHTLKRNEQILLESKYDIVQLPTPEPILYKKEPLPAGYANFYICNEFIVVPQFGLKTDQEAISILQNLAGSRKVIGLRSNYLLIGLGSFHCLSKQEPKF